MRIIVNGEARDVPEDLAVDSLLEYLKLPNERIAVERNGSVVRRADWPSAALAEGDKFEIIHFVGGG